MGMITLRQLRYLSALAKHGHFGRAAEACAVTQPALSMQIRDLERTLGVAVVERRPGDVMLTDVGREIARRGEEVLTASRDLVDFARHRSGLLTGRLTLGVIPSLAPYLLPRILPLLQNRFKELRLELRETQTRQLIEDIKSGALDAAMLALPVAEPDIDAIALFEDLFLLAVPANDPRKQNARVAAEDMGGTQPRKVIYFPATGRCKLRKLPPIENRIISHHEQLYRATLGKQAADVVGLPALVLGELDLAVGDR